MKRKDSDCAISCHPTLGPLFCKFPHDGDIFIFDKCNEENSCFIMNDGSNEYECHQDHKSSLFVKTAGPDEGNQFKVLDYEVYTQY